MKIRSSTYRSFLLLTGVWSLFALFMLLQSYLYRTRVGQTIDLGSLIAYEAAYAYTWALLTPLILWLAERFRIGARPFRYTIIHGLFGLVIAAVQKISSGSIAQAISDPSSFSWETQYRLVIAYLDYGLLVYAIILLLKYSFDYFHRYRETEIQRSQLETRLARANLQALRMQIHPHFLFNTLNAISVLINEDPAAARETLARLSELLRVTLEHDGVQEIALEQEIDFLERYLGIEKTRFGDRLTVRFDIDPGVRRAAVPTMILQPLVENAIKHGINRRRGPGCVEIIAERTNGRLVMQVKDNGAGLGERGEQRKGLGLSNTVERLEQTFGNEFRFGLSQNAEGGATALVEIPFRMLETAEE